MPVQIILFLLMPYASLLSMFRINKGFKKKYFANAKSVALSGPSRPKYA